MAETAYQTQYVQEFVAGYERGDTLLRQTVTTAANIQGNTAVFLVADSGGASAVTRGANGMIPARADSQTQNSCTLAEWHDLVHRSKGVIDFSQGPQRQIMQQGGMKVINRKTDDLIIAQLDTGTQDLGAAATATVRMASRALVILQNNNVPMDNDVYGLITPAFESELRLAPEFSSAKYVDRKPFEIGAKQRMFEWLGAWWIVHTGLTGIGTADEVCHLYHKSAIGHAMNMATIDIQIGTNEEQAYSFARHSVSMGAKLMQNSGVVLMHHDGSAYAAQ